MDSSAFARMGEGLAWAFVAVSVLLPAAAFGAGVFVGWLTWGGP